MEHLTHKGLVIRETDFGDNDRYISVLTEEGRRIEVLCKGVRRRGGRMMNAVRLFCYSELTLYQGRGGKYTLQQADLIASFWGVTESMETYALCCYLAELTGHMTDTEEDSPAAARLLLYALHALAEQKRDRLTVKAAFELRLMAESGYEPEVSRCSVCGAARLLLYALHALAEQKRDRLTVKAAFELRLMAESGYEPEVSRCSVCGEPLGNSPWFSPRDGVCRCASCAERLGAPGYVRLIPATFSAIRHILTQELPRVYAFALSGPARVQLAQVCEAYALCRAERGGPARVQLAQVCEAYALCRAERGFDSLTFYRSLEPEGAISPTFGAKT